MDDAIDMYLRLRGYAPLSGRETARKAMGGGATAGSKVNAHPAAVHVRDPVVAPIQALSAASATDHFLPPVNLPVTSPSPVLALGSLRMLQRAELIQQLEDHWGVFLLERTTLCAERTVARADEVAAATINPASLSSGLDIDLILDERTAVMVVPSDKATADSEQERLVSFLITNVASAFTTCWLILAFHLSRRQGDSAMTMLEPAIHIDLTTTLALGRLMGCCATLKHTVDLDMRVVGACADDEVAAWIRNAVQGAMEDCVARGTWTEDQWLQRTWLEPLESRV